MCVSLVFKRVSQGEVRSKETVRLVHMDSVFDDPERCVLEIFGRHNKWLIQVDLLLVARVARSGKRRVSKPVGKECRALAMNKRVKDEASAGESVVPERRDNGLGTSGGEHGDGSEVGFERVKI